MRSICPIRRRSRTLLGVTRAGLEVAAGDGRVVVLRQVQAPGGKRMAAVDYFRGHPLKG